MKNIINNYTKICNNFKKILKQILIINLNNNQTNFYKNLNRLKTNKNSQTIIIMKNNFNFK